MLLVACPASRLINPQIASVSLSMHSDDRTDFLLVSLNKLECYLGLENHFPDQTALTQFELVAVNNVFVYTAKITIPSGESVLHSIPT